jgi:serine protease
MHPTTRLLRHRRLSLAAASAVAVAAAMTTAATLPAQAAIHQATGQRAACTGLTRVVHLDGATFRVLVTGRFGVVPQRGKNIPVSQPAAATCRAPKRASGALQYGGGPLGSNARVFLDFWGSQWSSDRNGVQTYLGNLFRGLGSGSDNWSTTMRQYSTSVHNPSLGGTWVDSASSAPSRASQSQLSAEASRAASHFGVSGPSVDIFVVSPTGTHPDGFPSTGFCAWHSWNGRVAFTNMPYVLDAGASCGENSVRSALDGFSIVGGHEYAEAVTDPEPSSGWVDPANGEEIGDLCAWVNLQGINLGTGTFAMQPLWSNSANGCVQ